MQFVGRNILRLGCSRFDLILKFVLSKRNFGREETQRTGVDRVIFEINDFDVRHSFFYEKFVCRGLAERRLVQVDFIFKY